MPVFGGEGGGGGELFYFQRLELGGFFVPSSMGLLAGNIHYLFFSTSSSSFYLPDLTLLTLDPCFSFLYEEGLLQRRRVPYSS